MTVYHNLSGDVKGSQTFSGDLSQKKSFSANVSVTFYSGAKLDFNIGDGLKFDSDTNTLFVNTADAVEKDNTLPVTSAAVYTTVGNIEALLETI